MVTLTSGSTAQDGSARAAVFLTQRVRLVVRHGAGMTVLL